MVGAVLALDAQGMKRQSRPLSYHPVRESILTMLRYEDSMTVTAMADRMAMFVEPPPSIGVVAYHVRVLAQRGAIELVDETRVRGSIAHHYALNGA